MKFLDFVDIQHRLRTVDDPVKTAANLYQIFIP